MITETKKGQIELPKRIVCSVLTIFLMWQTLAATRNFSDIRKLSLSQAEDLVSKIDSKIPIEINPTVLKWLNYFMGTRPGKAFMLKSFERMHRYKPFLSEKLKKSKLPLELLAVPFMESGYDNSRVSSMAAAGIWQFIPSTARKYGLKVNSKIDERFNVDKLTNAAIAYYTDLINISEFNHDWRLALIAYNSGEGRLTRAIKKLGTKDPWAFNNLGDKDYLAKIIAGIILLNDANNNFLSHPLNSGQTSSAFGKRTTAARGKHFHRGVDIAAKLGTPILAPLAGHVKAAGFKNGFGNSIIINHGNNIETRFYHLENFSVIKGQRILENEQIGTVGSTGITTGPHLHFEVLINGKNVDPEIFF